MTAPRRVLPQAISFVTRRCSERRFFLKPSKLVNDTILYILAVAAQRYGILLHAFCVLSNHLHYVVTDPHARLPAFEQYVDALVARSVNALRGHWESFWAPGSYSSVTLTSSEDVIAKIAYVLANPVAAGLVRRGRDWPGVRSAPEQIGAGPILVKRPDHFFRPQGSMPEFATLELVCPAGFDSVESFREQLVTAVTRLEDQAARDLASEGRSFLGAAVVLAQSPHARPTAGEPHRQLNPRIAAKDKWRRIQALQALKSFLTAYRLAWSKFARGFRDTVFPHGTYGMRVLHGVRCAAPG